MGAIISSCVGVVASCHAKTLNLRGKRISNNDVIVISQELAINETVTMLDLRDNRFDQKGIEFLVEAIKENYTILLLKFDSLPVVRRELLAELNSYLFRNCVKHYSSVIDSVEKSLDELNLEFRDITDADCGPLTAALSTHKRRMSGLRLGFNEFGTMGCQSICDYVSSPVCRLTNLHLSGNVLGDEGGALIGLALARNHTIAELLLNNVSLGDAGTSDIADALKTNSTLQYLHLWGNFIGDDGAVALATALRVNCTLSTLVLKENGIRDDGCIALGEVLAVNSTLTLLDLDGNEFGPQSEEAFARGLLRSGHVVLTHLTGIDLARDTCLNILGLTWTKASDEPNFIVLEHLRDATRN